MKVLDQALAEVFRDASTHKEVAVIIADHLVNKTHVRKVALEGIDTSSCRVLLDLGCGFGFITRAIIDGLQLGARVPGIERHEEFRPYYLEYSTREGVDLSFLRGGILSISKIDIIYICKNPKTVPSQ